MYYYSGTHTYNERQNYPFIHSFTPNEYYAICERKKGEFERFLPVVNTWTRYDTQKLHRYLAQTINLTYIEAQKFDGLVVYICEISIVYVYEDFVHLFDLYTI